MHSVIVSSEGSGYGFLVDDHGRLRQAGFGPNIDAHMERLPDGIPVALYPLAYPAYDEEPTREQTPTETKRRDSGPVLLPGRLLVVGRISQGIQRNGDAVGQSLHVGVDVGPNPAWRRRPWSSTRKP